MTTCTQNAPDGFDMDAFTGELAQLVATDSKTGYIEGVERVMEFFEQRYASIGWTVTRHDCPGFGRALVASTRPDQSRYDVVLCGHADTVQPVGSAATNGLRIDEKGIAHGAGVADDKSSLLALWWLCKNLPKEVTDALDIAVIINPGEEAASPVTDAFFAVQARKTEACLVWEPGRAGGGCVCERKGSVPLKVRFHGVPAHAGNNPKDGRNAIYAMAQAVVEITALEPKYPGVTLNAGLVKGGSAVNTIAEDAEVVFDFRFTNDGARDAVIAQVRALCQRGFLEGVTSELEPSGMMSAMPRTDRTQELCRLVDEAAQLLGQDKPVWHSVGGASDANKFAAGGAAVVCSMGPEGGNLHDGRREWSDLNTVLPRIRLSRKVLELMARNKKAGR